MENYRAISVGTKPPVQRISASELTPELFRHYQTQAIPIVLTDVIQPEWDWHLDYLCDCLGAQDFILRHYGKDRYQQDKRTWTTIGSGVAPQSCPFVEYADLLRNGIAQAQDL